MVDSKQSQFDESHALRFFPTLVWKADLKRRSSQRINHDILNRLVDMRRSLPELQPGQAWQSGHPIHYHPNNFLSGVYYVKTHEGENTINFHDPRNQTGVIRPPVTELTAENTDQVVVKVTDGTLLVFPAWLPHSVDANLGVGERISISFNIMFSSFTESMSGPLWNAQ